VASGAAFIERVDLLVKLASVGAPDAEIDRTVETVDQKLNEKIVQGGSGRTEGTVGAQPPMEMPFCFKSFAIKSSGIA
jgi:hypothetical protein